MSGSAFRKWERAVEVLHNVTKDQDPDSSAELDAYEVMVDLLGKLDSVQPLPKSTWTKLVQDMQVCRVPCYHH